MLAGTATIEETVEICFSNDIDMMIEKERKAAWKHVKWAKHTGGVGEKLCSAEKLCF